jgi:hypothetical protein
MNPGKMLYKKDLIAQNYHYRIRDIDMTLRVHFFQIKTQNELEKVRKPEIAFPWLINRSCYRSNPGQNHSIFPSY